MKFVFLSSLIALCASAPAPTQLSFDNTPVIRFNVSTPEHQQLLSSALEDESLQDHLVLWSEGITSLTDLQLDPLAQRLLASTLDQIPHQTLIHDVGKLVAAEQAHLLENSVKLSARVSAGEVPSAADVFSDYQVTHSRN